MLNMAMAIDTKIQVEVVKLFKLKLTAYLINDKNNTFYSKIR